MKMKSIIMAVFAMLISVNVFAANTNTDFKGQAKSCLKQADAQLDRYKQFLQKNHKNDVAFHQQNINLANKLDKIMRRCINAANKASKQLRNNGNNENKAEIELLARLKKDMDKIIEQRFALTRQALTARKN